MSLLHHICSNKFKFIIAPIIVGIATSGLIFSQLYFYNMVSDSCQKIFRVSSILTYILCFISFYKAIVIQNAPPLTLYKPRLKNQLKNNHPLYTQVNLCTKQSSKYKSPRTSHCSKCKCVVRMDHHCPYIDNCVGLKNLKCFILFTGYGGLFAFQFLAFSVNFYFDLKGKHQQSPLTQGQITIWMILTGISFLLSLSMGGLSVSNLFLITKNITQLDLMKGQFKIQDNNGLHPNPFDLGFFTNLNLILQSDKWMFWWPTQIITQNDGTIYPMIPPVRWDDIKKLPKNIQEQTKSYFEKSIPNSIQELRKKQFQNYQKVIFFYLGEQYTLNEEHKETKSNKNQIQSIIQKREQNLLFSNQTQSQGIEQKKAEQKEGEYQGIESKQFEQKRGEQKAIENQNQQILNDLYGNEIQEDQDQIEEQVNKLQEV